MGGVVGGMVWRDAVICGRRKIDGSRWEGCGPGMPGPYGGGGRLAGAGREGRAAYMPPLRSDGNGQLEGSRPPPYDVKDKRVVMGKRAGRACPASTGGGRGNGCLPEGAREG